VRDKVVVRADQFGEKPGEDDTEDVFPLPMPSAL
jgi:hypothetical protein